MTPQDMIRKLAKKYGELRTDYSGRGMFGRKCMGIVTSDPEGLIVAMKRRKRELRSPGCDNMGLDCIVYWPDIENDTNEPSKS